MTVYAAFLRGINLGPINKISMARLRELATGLGYAEVKTYINSGNLILTTTASAAAVEQDLAATLKSELGKPIDVTVRSAAELAEIVADNPYPDGNQSQVTVAFLTASAPAAASDRIAAVAQAYEPFVIRGSEIYVHYGQGLGRSKLAERFSAIVGVSATVRTIRTVARVLDLATGS